MTTPAFVVANSGSNAFASSITMSLTGGVLANLAAIGFGATDRVSGTVIQSGTYDGVASTMGTGFLSQTGLDGRLLYNLLANSGTKNLIVTYNDANTRPGACGAIYSGVDGVSGVHNETTVTGTTDTNPRCTVPSATGELVVVMGAYSGSAVTLTPGTGVTTRVDATVDQFRVFMLEKAGAASVLCDCTLSSAREWWCVGISLVGATAALSAERGRTLARGLGRGMQ